MEWFFGDFWIVRLLFQRGMAALYLIAFIVALNQFRVLAGEKGLLPVPAFLKRVSFREAPSIFHWHYSDRFFGIVAWTGIVLSGIALLGLSERGSWWLSMLVWLTLYALYLSIVNVGQTFYGFGWESMLLEAGFFTAFLGPASLQVSIIPVLILRWMLFRTEVGAGLIKLRGDRCWRDLTCLYYHHETEPIPNPFSWYFHHLPKPMLRHGVAFSHFVQVVAPFLLFGSQPVAAVAAMLMIGHQFILIMGGNYSWLNWQVVVLGVLAFSDQLITTFLPVSIPALMPRPLIFDALLWGIAGVTVLLSIKPVRNLLSPRQVMNATYNPLHLVGSYGAFGSVTKERYEIIIEGTDDAVITPGTNWRAYEFKGKPGDVQRRPPQIAPYHLRLDWLMWFLPFSVMVTPSGITYPGHEVWFVRFIEKLLAGDRATLALLKSNPFSDEPPKFIRVQYYRYRYSTPEEQQTSGAWWRRTLIDEYLPPVALTDIRERS